MNVVSKVVAKDKCIGCGVCVAMCPKKVLSSKMAENGIFQISESEGCSDKCDICLQICPFYEKELKEDEISKKTYPNLEFHEDLGTYKCGYEFHLNDDKKRLKSASGGALGYVIEELFNSGAIDYAVMAVSEDIFKFKVVKKDEICTSSAYYPLSLDESLKFILENDANYAITALPCYAKALREAIGKNAKLKKRAKFILGLVCGQNKSANFTQKLANLSFGRENVELKSVNFRHKTKGKNALQFGFKFMDSHGQECIDDRSESAFKYWNSRAFTPFACNHCSDTFAKCADAVFMDAWLDDKIGDFRGHSLVLVRDDMIDEVFRNSSEFCKQIAVDRVLLSQISVVKNKKSIKYGDKNFLINKINSLKLEIQKESNANFECDEFINNAVKKIEKLNNLYIKYSLFKAIFRKIREKISGKRV